MITLDHGGRVRGTIRTLPVPPSIAEVASAIWIDDAPRSGFRRHEAAWRIVPDDAPHLIYSIDTGPSGARPQLNVVGARTAFADIAVAGRSLTAAVRLRPGSLPALFGIPASAFTDRSTPLASVDAKIARGLLDQLAARTPDQVAIELARVIERVAARGRTVDRRAHALLSHETDTRGSVTPIARELGISDRALRLWSGAHLGLGAKRFMRIRRLHRALDQRMANARITWSQAAAHAGYADHAHLVRDSQLLLGESPTAFLERARG